MGKERSRDEKHVKTQGRVKGHKSLLTFATVLEPGRFPERAQRPLLPITKQNLDRPTPETSHHRSPAYRSDRLRSPGRRSPALAALIKAHLIWEELGPEADRAPLVTASCHQQYHRSVSHTWGANKTFTCRRCSVNKADRRTC